MNYMIASDARKNLYTLIDHVALSHEPTFIKGKRNSVVVISQDDWDDIEETMFVMQNKNLNKTLLKGINTPYEECSRTLD